MQLYKICCCISFFVELLNVYKRKIVITLRTKNDLKLKRHTPGVGALTQLEVTRTEKIVNKAMLSDVTLHCYDKSRQKSQ